MSVSHSLEVVFSGLFEIVLLRKPFKVFKVFRSVLKFSEAFQSLPKPSEVF